MRKEKIEKIRNNNHKKKFIINEQLSQDQKISNSNENLDLSYGYTESSYKLNDARGIKKWYDELKYVKEEESEKLSFEEIQNLKKEASNIFNDAVIKNNNTKVIEKMQFLFNINLFASDICDAFDKAKEAPKSLSSSDYAWVKTVMSKGTKTDKIAAYTLLIQDSPIYNLGLLKNMVEMVKVGKKKECFMAIDTLCELFLKDLLPTNRKLIVFNEQPLSKLGNLSSGNYMGKNKRLLLWYFEDQLKSIYKDFITYLIKISYDSIEANKQKVITAMYKLLEGNSEMENLLLNSIVNKLGDPSRKVGSKTIYVLIKLLQTHPNMKEVVANAVEKVIFRNNISRRAQYYSICFLSQFCLFTGEKLVAKKLVSIYLSLFKACVKTGDIDSRMMSALLTGVNRAFPYLEEENAIIQNQINTFYKIIHLSHANIAIHALSLVHLISADSNTSSDRFYSVLYKKIGEPEMFQSTHHAMLINLIFKALKKDKEKNRICAFIKRLLQVCAYIAVPVACGILIMISEILKSKGEILLKEFIPTSTIKIEEDSDDGEEYYQDIAENMPTSEFSEPTEVEEKKEKETFSTHMFNVKNPAEENEVKVWSNPDKSLENPKAEGMREYDPSVRNPLYVGAQNCLCYELFELIHHFHPTVSLFAQKLINGEVIKYSGDPFLDFTLIRFLDKFSFKNPKQIKPEEERNESFAKFNRKKYYSAAPIRRLRANTIEYLKLNENSIPVDEVFLYRFMKQKMGVEIKTKKKTEDTSDLESVGSDEFDNFMADIIDGKKDEIDFRKEVGQFSKIDENKKKKGRKGNEYDDFDNSEILDEHESDDGSFAEDFDGDEIDEDDDEDFGGSDTDEDMAELEASGFKLPDLPCLKNQKTKNKFKKDFNKDDYFASAEEFAEVLEEADLNGGDSEAVSNKDRAALKQLKWESLRDKWINKKDFRRKSFKRPHQGKSNKSSFKGIKKKRF